ncbi:hypothetical protein BJX64DRAFT_125289 [Aspergillus heterothallicus]
MLTMENYKIAHKGNMTVRRCRHPQWPTWSQFWGKKMQHGRALVLPERDFILGRARKCEDPMWNGPPDAVRRKRIISCSIGPGFYLTLYQSPETKALTVGQGRTCVEGRYTVRSMPNDEEDKRSVRAFCTEGFVKRSAAAYSVVWWQVIISQHLALFAGLLLDSL